MVTTAVPIVQHGRVGRREDYNTNKHIRVRQNLLCGICVQYASLTNASDRARPDEFHLSELELRVVRGSGLNVPAEPVKFEMNARRLWHGATYSLWWASLVGMMYAASECFARRVRNWVSFASADILDTRSGCAST